jgi:hypothetical protein
VFVCNDGAHSWSRTAVCAIALSVLIQPESNWEDCKSMTADSGSMQLFDRYIDYTA